MTASLAPTPDAEPILDLADIDLAGDDAELAIEPTAIDPATSTPEAAPSPPTAADLAGKVVELAYSLLDRADKLPDLYTRHTQTLSRMQDAGAKWSAARKAAEDEYSAAMTPLSATLASLEVEIAAAENAKQRLTELATTPQIAPTT